MGSIRIEAGNEYESKPPKGAKILKHNVDTTIRKIDNGYIIRKSHNGKYQTGKGEKDYNYFDYAEEFFSEENPVTINIPDEVDLEVDSDLANKFPGITEKK